MDTLIHNTPGFIDMLLYIVPSVVAVLLLYHAVIVKHVIREFERGLLYRNGRFRGALQPGAYRDLKYRTEVKVIDRRKQSTSIPGQEVMTADQIGLKVSLVVSYTVVDPVVAIHKVKDYEQEIYLAGQLALRKVVGALTIDELLEQRSSIGSELKSEVVFVMEPLGIEVHDFEVKDVMLPAEARKAFSKVVHARKEGQAALERARGEMATLRTLANAARLMNDNPALLNLRLFQAISESKVGHTLMINTHDGFAPGKPPSGPQPSADATSA